MAPAFGPIEVRRPSREQQGVPWDHRMGAPFFSQREPTAAGHAKDQHMLENPFRPFDEMPLCLG